MYRLHSKWIYILLIGIIITAIDMGSFTPPVFAVRPVTDTSLVILPPGDQLEQVATAITQAGGHVIHIFPPSALIAQLPTDITLPSSALVTHQALDAATIAGLDAERRHVAQVWNALQATAENAGTYLDTSNLAQELVGDALLPPPPAHMPQSTGGDPTPGYVETSEFMIGTVAVGIILPESDGRVDSSTEDWTEEERSLVLSEITSALNWWAGLEPNAHLTFVYDDGTTDPTPTAYEPIARPHSDQSYWIAEVMATKGYTSTSYFDQVRQYNQFLRDTCHTDWAFTIFVVDSSNDANNRFSDGYFAYAYLGGPFMVMTFGNNGYGPHNMDAVAAHEIGHIFMALDQYYAAHQPCNRPSGYLGVENQNSQYGTCYSDEPSIMRGQITPYTQGAVDPYARGQIGWRDSDGDGILDPMDTSLEVISATIMTDTEHTNVLTVTGKVEDYPYPSPFRRSITINTITRVQYRIAGGEWQDTQPVDGDFDSWTEEFAFVTPPLPSGDLSIEVKLLDSAGNVATHTLTTVAIVDPTDKILDTAMTRLAQDGADGETQTTITYHGRGTSAISYIAAMYYRIDNDDWQLLTPADGAFDDPVEEFSFSVDIHTLGPGNHQVQAYSVDGLGNVETSPAQDFVNVPQAPGWCVFLPLVMSHP